MCGGVRDIPAPTSQHKSSHYGHVGDDDDAGNNGKFMEAHMTPYHLDEGENEDVVVVVAHDNFLLPTKPQSGPVGLSIIAAAPTVSMKCPDVREARGKRMGVVGKKPAGATTQHSHDHQDMDHDDGYGGGRKCASIFFTAASPPPIRNPSYASFGSCLWCTRPLTPHTDLYMYRGDRAFCSSECRYQQMDVDERNERLATSSIYQHKQSPKPNKVNYQAATIEIVG